jgi:hypothetical protein
MSERSNLPQWFDDTFILTLVGLIGGGGTAILTYFLKSRCRTVECCCIKCERNVIPIDASQVTIA